MSEEGGREEFGLMSNPGSLLGALVQVVLK